MAETNAYGYDVVDEVFTGGKYLSFKKGDKGRIIQIKLASRPVYVNQHWVLSSDGKQSPINCKGEDCPYCGKAVPQAEKLPKTAKWAWVVIDREDGGAKMFTGPTLIAKRIKEISELLDKKTGKAVWGDPLTFDIQVERTEEPGANYYKVSPMPDGKGTGLTELEKKAVEDANIDLKKELADSKESQHLGQYGANEMETVPDVTGTPESSMNENVNPNDIPF